MRLLAALEASDVMFLMFTPGHRIFVALNCKTSPRNDASTFEKMLEMKISTYVKKDTA